MASLYLAFMHRYLPLLLLFTACADQVRKAAPDTTNALAATAASQPAPAEPTNVRIAAGERHACMLDADGTARCWGSNEVGQLGIGSAAEEQLTPFEIAGFRFRALGAGADHTCGVTAGHELYCWGASVQAPRVVPTTARLESLSAGHTHTCGLDAAGLAYCWGFNLMGQLGTGDTIAADAPARVVGERAYKQISAGATHTCAVSRTNELYCWGSNAFRERGRDGEANALAPELVQLGVPVATVAAGEGNTCAVDTAGGLWCWGHDQAGVLGNGSTGRSFASSSPARIGPDEPMAGVTLGTVHACAWSEAGNAYCWGRNDQHALGTTTEELCPGLTPTPSCGTRPVRVDGNLRFKQIAASAWSTCGVTTANEVYCWGANIAGELGTGTSKSEAAPRRIALER